MVLSRNCTALEHDAGGEGSPTLVLLHGMAVNRRAFDAMRPLVEDRWPGRWIAPDLRGHGASPHAAPYAYGTHAADVANLLAGDGPVLLLGHSMGGVVAMMLATGWFGIEVKGAFAFGVKLTWTAEEVSKLHDIAARPARHFDSEDEAVGRYLLVSGMAGHVDPASPVARSGVTEEGDSFRLAADSRIMQAAGPDIGAICRAAAAPVRLAAGADDPMVTAAEMRALDPAAVVFDGAGHNVHLEQPAALWAAFETFAAKL